MTDHDPKPTTGETLEGMIEDVLFEDPSTHPIRDEWERTKAEEQAVYDRVCREEYERRLEYHRICRTSKPEEMARHETNLCKILFREELDARLAERWKLVLRRVMSVLADKAAASEETPGTDSASRRADNSGT
jgi:hypothetical protein